MNVRRTDPPHPGSFKNMTKAYVMLMEYKPYPKVRDEYDWFPIRRTYQHLWSALRYGGICSWGRPYIVLEAVSGDVVFKSWEDENPYIEG